ncbi:MAG: hypothetical protein ABII97_01940 [Patescibacteria group bacterium]
MDYRLMLEGVDAQSILSGIADSDMTVTIIVAKRKGVPGMIIPHFEPTTIPPGLPESFRLEHGEFYWGSFSRFSPEEVMAIEIISNKECESARIFLS